MEAMPAGEHTVALSMMTIASDHLDWFRRSAPSRQVTCCAKTFTVRRHRSGSYPRSDPAAGCA